MAFTALMSVLLIASYALMFGFVKFTETLIARPEFVSRSENDSARANEAEGGM